MEHSLQQTLSGAIWPVSSKKGIKTFLLRNICLTIAGVALLTISAKIKIPFWPVPMTLQTMIIMVLGLAYGLRLGTSTVVAYLACGAIGIPVFASGAGLAYMVGPTGGYLVGFIFATLLLGYLGDKGWSKSYGRMAIAMFVGTVIIFLCGVTWLANLFGFDKALTLGLYPFVLAEVCKGVFALVALPTVWKLIQPKQ